VEVIIRWRLRELTATSPHPAASRIQHLLPSSIKSMSRYNGGAVASAAANLITDTTARRKSTVVMDAAMATD